MVARHRGRCGVGQGGSLRRQQELAPGARKECDTGLGELNVSTFRSSQQRSGTGTYTKGGDGLHHGEVLGRCEGSVGGGEVALLDALARTRTALDVDLLGRHFDWLWFWWCVERLKRLQKVSTFADVRLSCFFAGALIPASRLFAGIKGMLRYSSTSSSNVIPTRPLQHHESKAAASPLLCGNISQQRHSKLLGDLNICRLPRKFAGYG